MKKVDELVKRANDELGMELFRDRVQLNNGVMEYHLRADKHSAAWPHFKTLDEVEEAMEMTMKIIAMTLVFEYGIAMAFLVIGIKRDLRINLELMQKNVGREYPSMPVEYDARSFADRVDAFLRDLDSNLTKIRSTTEKVTLND